MPIYRTSFEMIRQQPSLQLLLEALERGFKRFAIDFYLVGAVSRDVWMNGINNIAPLRATTDLDFAVYINDKGLYEQLKEYLVTAEGFTSRKQNSFVLIYTDGTEVDLMPFGAIEDENRKVTVEGFGFTSIHVDGLKEVFEQGLPEIALDGARPFKFCTLPGIVLLKLIAWDDRPEDRRDDIIDISDVLSHFFEMCKELIYEEHNDLFENPAKDLLFIGAHVLGREIKKITLRDEKLHARVQRILEQNTADPLQSKMAFIMRAYFDNTVEESILLINEIRQGFE